MTKWTSAPLPFVGQKRFAAKVLTDWARNLPQGATVLDLFGGSLLCSRVVKDARPDLTVVANDFDGFRLRLKRIPQTNRLLEDLRQICAAHHIPKKAKIPKGSTAHREVVACLRQAQDHHNGLDWVTVMSALAFSARTVYEGETLRLRDCVAHPDDPAKAYQLYHRIPEKPYHDADGYLDGLVVESDHWLDLLERYRAGGEPLALLLDPPYVATHTTHYNGVYSMVTDTLKLLGEVVKTRPVSWLMFNGAKSDLDSLFETLSQYFGVSSLRGVGKVDAGRSGVSAGSMTSNYAWIGSNS